MLHPVSLIPQVPFENRQLSFEEFFQKLSNTEDLIKELDSIKKPSSTYSEIYVSQMLTGDFNELVFDWVAKQLTIDRFWKTNWLENNQVQFDQAISHLNFDQKFSLMAGAYRLAHLVEQTANDSLSRHNSQEAAAVFKVYLTRLIDNNPFAYQKLDLSNLSIKNSQTFKLNQSALSPDFINEIRRQNLSLEQEKNSFNFKILAAGILTLGAAAGGTYAYRLFTAKLLPPPEDTFWEKTYKFLLVKDVVPLILLGLSVPLVSVISSCYQRIKKNREPAEKAKCIELIRQAVSKVKENDIKQIGMELKVTWDYINTIKEFLVYLGYQKTSLFDDLEKIKDKMRNLSTYQVLKLDGDLWDNEFKRKPFKGKNLDEAKSHIQSLQRFLPKSLRLL